MGSYGYVASLAEFVRSDVARASAPGRDLAINQFVLLTKGGGFEEIPARTLPGLLDAARAARTVLAGLRIEAAVPYKDGKPIEDQWLSAEPPRNSLGGPGWHMSRNDESGEAGTGSFCAGVHQGLGIAIMPTSDWQRLPDPNNIIYFKGPTSDPRVMAMFRSPFEKTQASEADEVRFETVPALPNFAHLIETFERISVKAIAHGRGIDGC